MGQVRKPFQGVGNIIRFNRHFYILAGVSLLFLAFLRGVVPDGLRIIISLLFLVVFAATFLSLFASFWVYDLSDLYKLKWLDRFSPEDRFRLINIHAGFDETSALLIGKFNNAEIEVYDFYDPGDHTEVAVKRARETSDSPDAARKVKTTELPAADSSTDMILLFMAAHEIRCPDERSRFFREAARILKPDGTIIVVEHLRDIANFIAYSAGFTHFYSKASWMRAFDSAGLKKEREIKITPFVSVFMLGKQSLTAADA